MLQSIICFFCFSFFSISFFSHENSRFTGQQVKRETPYILSTISTHFCAQLAAGIEHEIFSTRSLEFTLSTLALVAAVVRRILKTRVALGNISRVLLNLTKRLISAMFKDSSPLPVFTQLTVIFSR